jgi:DNA-binding response OmpR family regulator
MRVLVVDDEPDVVESIRLGFTLQWREVDVLGAADGETALDLVEQEHPDVVLLDVGLRISTASRCCGASARSRMCRS